MPFSRRHSLCESRSATSRATSCPSAWRTTDATAVFSGLKSSGISLRPQIKVRAATTVAIEMRTYEFDATSRPTATSSGSGFGSREQQLGISLSTYVRQYYLNSSAFLGNVTRTVSPAGQSVLTDRTPRNYLTANAGWSGAGGVVELQSRIEQTRDRGGFVNQQSVFGFAASRSCAMDWRNSGRGRAQSVNGFGSEKSAIMRPASPFHW